jgi:predicted nucleotidyltransferase
MIEELTDICEKLNRHNVEYLVIGGCAVNYYGYKRLTLNPNNELTNKPDIDIWFNPTLENYYRNLCSVLEELGLDKSSYNRGMDIKKSFIKVEFDDFGLDCLPVMENFVKTFRECYRNRIMTKTNNIQIPFISLEDLILSKETSNRPKDTEDIEELKKILNRTITRFKDF